MASPQDGPVINLKLVDETYTKMLGVCGTFQSGDIRGACAQNLPPGALRALGTATLNVYLRIDLQLRFSFQVVVTPQGQIRVAVSWPKLCVRLYGGAEIVGATGVMVAVDYCLGGQIHADAAYYNNISHWSGAELFLEDQSCFTTVGGPTHLNDIGEQSPNPVWSQQLVWYHGCCPGGALALKATELAGTCRLSGVFYYWNSGYFQLPTATNCLPIQRDRLVLFDLTSDPNENEVRLESPLMQPQVTRAVWMDDRFQSEIDNETVSATQPEGKVVGFVAYVRMDPQANAPNNLTVSVRASQVGSTGCVTALPNPTPSSSGQIPKTGMEVPFKFLIRIVPPFNDSNCTTAVVRYQGEISLSNNDKFEQCTNPHAMPPLTVTVIPPPPPQKTVKIKNATFNPTTTNPGGTSRLTVQVETENTSKQLIYVRVSRVDAQSDGCGLLTTAEQTTIGKLGRDSGPPLEFEFIILVPQGCNPPSGRATWLVEFVDLPPGVTCPPSSTCTTTATFMIAPGINYVRPRVISLAVGQTTQLTPENHICESPTELQFPQGTTFATNHTGVADIPTPGSVRGRSAGVADVQVRLPGSNVDLRTAQQGCVVGDLPRVQVGPMTVKLRFLDDAVLYLRDTANGGLGLGQALVDKIKTRTKDRVQQLFSATGANVNIELAQEGVTVADNDAVMVVDISAHRDANGRFLRAPDQLPGINTESMYILGRALENHLNLNFGGDIIYNPNLPEDRRHGVFVNRLPFYKNRILDINIIDDIHIGNGIGNVAAHEAGHRLGLVPNPKTNPDPNPMDPNQPKSSEELRDKIRDDRFTGWNFDGTSMNHTREAVDTSEVMSWETFEPSVITGVPFVFGDTQKFRADPRQDAEYLRTILPRL